MIIPMGNFTQDLRFFINSALTDHLIYAPEGRLIMRMQAGRPGCKTFITNPVEDKCGGIARDLCRLVIAAAFMLCGRFTLFAEAMFYTERLPALTT